MDRVCGACRITLTALTACSFWLKRELKARNIVGWFGVREKYYYTL